MKYFALQLLLIVLVTGQISAQKSSLIILGDLHYDLPGDHDMEWLSDKPGDLRQVTEEYTVYTRENWADFMDILKERAEEEDLSVEAIVQLGDLSEGLAGNEEKALQMASNAMKAIDSAQMPVPWILAKGNHDVTGPGAVRAYQEHYIPMIRRQTGDPSIQGANYSYRSGNLQITCVDPWDRETDMVAFLEGELSGSPAKFKFVAIHEPVIPVTERCWHTLRNDPVRREELLKVIASHKAIVLCGHLHRYAVVKRQTPYGPVVQVMVTSVIRDRNYLKPAEVVTTYGPSLAENRPEWQPETLSERKAFLAAEAKYVSYYRQSDLPGYAVIRIDEKSGSIKLEYYAGFGKRAFETINLSKLLEN